MITLDWSDDAENSDLHHRNKLYFTIYLNREQTVIIFIIVINYQLSHYFDQIKADLVSIRDYVAAT